MKILIDDANKLTVAQLIAALDKVENKEIPVKVWDSWNVKELTVGFVDYGRVDPAEESALWFNLEHE